VRIWRYVDLARALALVALAASVALLGNYLRPGPGLCPFNSSCEEVLFSRFGHLLGVPLPVIGVLAFAGIFALLCYPCSWSAQLLVPLALAVAAGGAAFLFLQVFVLGRLCAFCLVIDTSAILIGLIQVARRWLGPWPSLGRQALAIWLGAGAMALGLGAALGLAGGDPDSLNDGQTPPELAALWLPGRVNVVEVADFQCPQCRRMHPVVMELVRTERERIQFVRITAPMPSHRQARDASRAFLCAQHQRKGDEMAEALFAAPTLEPEICERFAAALGLSVMPFRACVADPATDERLDEDVAWVRAATPNGLPAIWIQNRLFSGVQPLGALRQAVSDAAEQLENRTP